VPAFAAAAGTVDMPAVKNVLIVGAGMAGMTLGVALKRAGIACEIAEIRADLTEPGTGISLQGPALRVLHSVGMADGCIARGFGYSYFKACDAHGNVTGTVDLPRLLGPGYPATIGILRQSVHEVLAEELSRQDVPIRLSTTVTSLEQHDDGVDVELTGGRRARYDLVVGADGGNSAIRDLTMGTQHRPRYTGQMNWRATVSRPPDVQGRYSYFGPTNKSGFNPISEQHMYIYILQNVPQRPRWADAELPGQDAGAARGIRRRTGPGAGRDQHPGPDHLPAGVFDDHGAAVASRARRHHRRCRAHDDTAARQRRQHRD
jgi:2-polyprenyl-6-methoxyphenol hydroxylase-like FAD-dependent oxidoreductase